MAIQGSAAGITCAGQSRDKTYEDRRTLPLWPDHLRGGSRSDDAHHLPLYRLPNAHRLGVPHKYPRAGPAFVLRSGTPKSYVKTADSGNKRRHAFCGDCGTPIYACAVDNPQTYACASARSPSVRPSHRGGKAGGVLRCTGSTRRNPAPGRMCRRAACGCGCSHRRACFPPPRLYQADRLLNAFG